MTEPCGGGPPALLLPDLLLPGILVRREEAEGGALYRRRPVASLVAGAAGMELGMTDLRASLGLRAYGPVRYAYTTASAAFGVVL
jgi:hypothetical protein